MPSVWRCALVTPKPADTCIHGSFFCRGDCRATRWYANDRAANESVLMNWNYVLSVNEPVLRRGPGGEVALSYASATPGMATIISQTHHHE